MKTSLHTTFKLTIASVFALAMLPAGAASAAAPDVTPAEARAIAKEAYIYAYPMVDGYRIQYGYFVDKTDPEYKGQWNEIHNIPRVYTPEDKAVQTPNSDTPYSFLGADLRAEPLVLTVPEIPEGRYYSIQFIDAYTFNFAYAGSRTTGNEAGSIMLAGPNWKGEKPQGIKEVIQSETEINTLIYRTQLFDPTDLDNVKRIQSEYKVQPLSQFLGQPAPTPAPAIDFIKPISQEEQKSSLEVFNILNFVLQFSPTVPSEKELMERFAKIGIGAGKTFDPTKLSPEMKKAFEEGIGDAWKDFAGGAKLLGEGKITAGDVFGTRASMKNNYFYRWLATIGIWGNSKQEAMYPIYFTDASGQKLNGANRYTLHFPKGQLPPAHAFWSLTMYQLPESLLVANPIDRYLINSPMLPKLKMDTDGGLTLYIQHESPGKDLESNWLPAPKGPFSSYLRIYWPAEAALDGSWTAPKLEMVKPDSAKVTVDNFVRAEADTYFKRYAAAGGFGKMVHIRQPTPLDKQDVIRMNQDTLYSIGIFDLTTPLTITKPETDRWQSMLLINQDHSILPAIYEPGTYTFTQEQIGTRYLAVVFRTLMKANDPDDILQANALQDQITVQQADAGALEVPDWDEESLGTVRDALNVLSATLSDTSVMFGEKDKLNPIHHLLGTAFGFGGNPKKDAMYINVYPEQNDGSVNHRLYVKDVPVDGFFSITVYNKDGFMEPNDLGINSVNNFTATPDPNGGATVHFGGCDDGRVNCIPITDGWNYIVRLYQPGQALLDGSWSFPDPTPVK